MATKNKSQIATATKASGKASKVTSKVSGPINVRANPIDLWLEYLIYAIVIMVPLLFSRITFDQFDIAKMALFRLLTLGVLILWLIRIFTSKRVRISWTRMDLLLAGFLILVFLSTLTSIHLFTALQGKYKRFEGLYTFINYGIIYFLSLQVFSDRRKLARLARVISLTAAVVAFYGLIQYFGLDPINWGQTPFEARSSFSTFGNPDLLGAYLALALPMALGAYLSVKNNFKNVLYGLAFFLISASLITTHTRGAWLGALVGLIAYLLIVRFKGLKGQLEKVMIVGLAFLVFFTGILIYSSNAGQGVMNLSERITSTAQLSDGTVGSRLEIWKAGLAMVGNRPLLGQGADTFRLASEKYETLKYVKMVRGKTVADNAHNYPVQLMAGVGIPATVLFLAFIISIFYYSSRAGRKQFADSTGPESSDNFSVVGLVAGAIGYFTYLCSGISVVGSSAIFWIVLAAIIGMSGLKKTREADQQSAFAANTILAIVLLIPMILGTYTFITMVTADYDFAQAYSLTNAGSPAAFAAYEEAFSLYPNGRYESDLGRLYLQINQTDRAITALNKAKEAEPPEADYRVLLANAYYVKYSQTKDPGYLKTAVNEVSLVVARRPYSVPGQYLLGVLDIRLGRYRQAAEHLRIAADVDPGYSEAFTQLSLVYKRLGNNKLADSYAKKAAAAKTTP